MYFVPIGIASRENSSYNETVRRLKLLPKIRRNRQYEYERGNKKDEAGQPKAGGTFRSAEKSGT